MDKIGREIKTVAEIKIPLTSIVTKATEHQLQQEIHADYKAVQTVIKDPSLVGKAIVTEFKTQVEDLDRRLEQGDYFRAGQGLGES